MDCGWPRGTPNAWMQVGAVAFAANALDTDNLSVLAQALAAVRWRHDAPALLAAIRDRC